MSVVISAQISLPPLKPIVSVSVCPFFIIAYLSDSKEARKSKLISGASSHFSISLKLVVSIFKHKTEITLQTQ